jgi:hypothetical protein
MVSHYSPVRGTDIFCVGQILLLVGDIPCHTYDVFGTGASFCQDGNDVLQHLTRLIPDLVADYFLLFIPTDRAADVNLTAGRSDAISVTFRFWPSLWLEKLQVRSRAGL